MEAKSPALARPVAAVTGYFDVVLAADAAELEAVREETGAATLIALVSSPPCPVLSPRARAEMAASLRVVDYVVVLENGPGLEALLAALAPDRTVRAETAQQKRFAQLVQNVHRRQSG